MGKINKKKMFSSGKRYFEWTIFQLAAVDQDFFKLFKKKLGVIPEETLNMSFFSFEDQSVYEMVSFDNEAEAMKYAQEESLENKDALYIVKCRFVDASILSKGPVDVYAYHFVGFAFQGNVENHEKEEFKRHRELI